MLGHATCLHYSPERAGFRRVSVSHLLTRSFATQEERQWREPAESDCLFEHQWAVMVASGRFGLALVPVSCSDNERGILDELTLPTLVSRMCGSSIPTYSL